MDKLAGFAIVFLSTIFYASINPLLKKTSTHVSPFVIIAVTSFTIFCLAILAAIFIEHSLPMKTNILKTYIPYIIAAGVLNICGFWLSIAGFKYMPVWQQGMFMLLTPIAAGIFGYFLLGEKITPNLFVGLLIMGFGLLIALK